MTSLITKRRVFTPGPTPLLPEAMMQALCVPMHHRKEDFKSVFCEVQRSLRQVYRTENEILLLSCSGSGAMEAAVTNTLSIGEKALIGVCGKFGERWKELAEKFGVNARVLEFPYGESVDPLELEKALLADDEIAVVFIQATETSTGARNDVERIGRMIARRPNTVLVVDGITGLGTMPLETDAWGLDIVIGGSQKAFMVPPGVAMISVSPKAWSRIEKCTRPRYYFDLARERKGQKEGQSAFTPSISVIQGLQVALDTILKDGPENLVRNATCHAEIMRAAVHAWGMQIFSKSPGNAITAFVPTPGVDPARVIGVMRDRFGVLISGGQGSMKGKILRVGHLGYFDFLETLGMIACLELSMIECGARIEIGTGAKAAASRFTEVYRES